MGSRKKGDGEEKATLENETFGFSLIDAKGGAA